MMTKGRNDNHPRKGSSIKVQPIRSFEAIAAIRAHLYGHPRNLCLFTLGINTAYRASELLSLTVGQVDHLKAGDILDIKQQKTNEYRMAVLNTVAVDAIQSWLTLHPCRSTATAPLFLSQRGRRSLSVSAVNRLVKSWCRETGLSGNFGSHSLRKTWGYHQRIHNNANVALLMRAFGHATEAQTLDYLCILPDEIKALYLGLEL
ncbi:Phage integrase family protein [Thalassolituus maritimus]|uniref:Phage integrase family protein n=1 Tax=Thalassolituus maritimus TaxID=484498 RepID=A0A1N7IXK4_9GAMM|nr:tyrosine-type recombinase/integrase [Thalassolituus maritimus]SIS41842.1 Phage integrase family protein [Thalassolituus maritimus]